RAAGGGRAGGLQAGWAWLDEARGLAVPDDSSLTGGVPPPRAQWRAARPGQGRGYAVHLPTGMIAVPGGPGEAPHSVHAVGYGWVRYGSDLVHRTSGLALHSAGATLGRAHPALLAELGGDQLNRDD